MYLKYIICQIYLLASTCPTPPATLSKDLTLQGDLKLKRDGMIFGDCLPTAFGHNNQNPPSCPSVLTSAEKYEQFDEEHAAFTLYVQDEGLNENLNRDAWYRIRISHNIDPSWVIFMW